MGLAPGGLALNFFCAASSFIMSMQLQCHRLSDYLMDGWSRISEPPLSRASSRASFLDVPSLAGLDAGHGSQLQARGTSGS